MLRVPSPDRDAAEALHAMQAITNKQRVFDTAMVVVTEAAQLQVWLEGFSDYLVVRVWRGRHFIPGLGVRLKDG